MNKHFSNNTIAWIWALGGLSPPGWFGPYLPKKMGIVCQNAMEFVWFLVISIIIGIQIVIIINFT